MGTALDLGAVGKRILANNVVHVYIMSYYLGNLKEDQVWECISDQVA